MGKTMKRVNPKSIKISNEIEKWSEKGDIVYFNIFETTPGTSVIYMDLIFPNCMSKKIMLPLCLPSVCGGR